MMSLAAVYFPNVVQRSAATVVSVGRGEVRAGLDLTFPMLRTYRVSGTLLSAVGEFKGLPEVFLVEASAIEGFGFGQEAQGTSFNFAGVAPGVYTLVAFVPDQRIFAMADVRVSDQDVHLTLSMQPGLTMSGKVTFAGKTPPPDPSRVRIGLSPASGGIMLEPVQGTLKPDGTFTVEGLVPGMYRLTANLGGAPGWSLLSAVSGGREMSVAPVEINANSAADGIAVTFTDRQTELTGRLQDAAGVAAADYFIIVFSTSERAWYERSRAIAQTRPASDGQFTVRNLPPGEYFLAAVTDVEPNEWFNPAFLRELVPAAIRLTLAEGERKVQNVQIK
jgi:hypothetical protein